MASHPPIATVIPSSNLQRELFTSFAIAVCALVTAGLIMGGAGLKMLPVSLGWPHIILGFIFYCGKVIRRERALRSLIVLSLLTGVIWWTHQQFDITRLIYLFFFYHAFTDEIFVRAVGSSGASVTNRRTLILASAAVVLLFLIPHPRDLLINLRRTQITSSQITQSGPTLISFAPVSNSKGKQFYFYLVAPNTVGIEAFTTEAAIGDSYPSGAVLVNDDPWGKASDLIFRPYYSAAKALSPDQDFHSPTIPVLLTGGHRVGQTFTATEDNLAGIWLPVQIRSESNINMSFVLESLPQIPGPLGVGNFRALLVFLLAGFALWTFGTRWLRYREQWAGLMALAAAMVTLQASFNDSIRLSEIDSHVFQLVVVFHYLLWYTFSFRRMKTRWSPPPYIIKGRYDRFLTWLAQPLQFSIAVVLLNVVSIIGVVCYHSLGGPALLSFAFDYNYFLYALVFHVTFSLHPPRSAQPKEKLATEPAAAGIV